MCATLKLSERKKLLGKVDSGENPGSLPVRKLVVKTEQLVAGTVAH